MSKILITGATGHLGSLTIEFLLEKGIPSDRIVALARNEEKAKSLSDKGIEVRVASFDDLNSLEKATNGIQKVLLISGLDHNRLQQHKNVVDAAKKAGVEHIFYTGVSMKDPSTSVNPIMDDHFSTEDYIKDSGLVYTFLRNSLYSDTIPMFSGEKAIEHGIYLPTKNGKVAFVLRRDLAEATANILFQNGHENKTYQLTGNNLYSFQDIADILSELTAKEVMYNNISSEKFIDILKQAGLPDAMISIVSGFAGDIKNGQYEIQTDDLEVILNRKSFSTIDQLRELYL